MKFNFKKQITIFSCVSLFAFSQIGCADSGPNISLEQAVENSPRLMSHDERKRNAIHSGQKTSNYVKGDKVLVDLAIVGIKVDPKRISRGLTIEQSDMLWLYLADELPAGTDFAILGSKLQEGNLSLVDIVFTENADEISFDEITAVLSAEAIVANSWGESYFGESNYFLEPWSWTKETGIKAIEKAFKEGASEVEATIVFKETYDPKLRNTAQYKEVMIFLQDGQDIADPYIHMHITPTFGTKLRFEQLEYLKKHPSVANVVPNLPEQN